MFRNMYYCDVRQPMTWVTVSSRRLGICRIWMQEEHVDLIKLVIYCMWMEYNVCARKSTRNVKYTWIKTPREWSGNTWFNIWNMNLQYIKKRQAYVIDPEMHPIKWTDIRLDKWTKCRLYVNDPDHAIFKSNRNIL